MIEAGSQSPIPQPHEAQIRASLLEDFSEQQAVRNPLAAHEGSTRTHKLTGWTFRGWLEVEGVQTTSPTMQDFTIYEPTETSRIIKNHPVFPSPSIEIELGASSPNSPFKVLRFDVRPTGSTTDAEIEYTRLFFALATTSKCSLRIKGGDVLFNFKMQGASSEGEQTFHYRAKLFRKLKFIEIVYRTQFRWPTEISAEDAFQIEIVFRGITEGEFTFRTDSITFYNYAPPAPEELNGPPFTEPGSFIQWVSNHAPIFDRLLAVGPVSIHLDRAIIANSRVMDKLLAGEPVPQIRFIVFDHQIRHRFEKYAALSPQTRRRRLEQFKKKLLKEEPEALVALLEEPLALDVSADEARRIVVGWLQYNMFPDRFWPQEPSRENNRWRVPVWVTAPQGQGGWVQDVFVDLKTGIVSTPISAEELRALGKSVSAETLRAS
jgi:hypothetical protein